LYAKFDKYDFYKRNIWYLGNEISEDGIAVDPKNIKDIMECPIPKDVAYIRSFIGIADY